MSFPLETGVGMGVKKKIQPCPWENIQMILTPRSQKLGASCLQVLSEKCTQSPGGYSSEKKPQFLPEYFPGAVHSIWRMAA